MKNKLVLLFVLLILLPGTVFAFQDAPAVPADAGDTVAPVDSDAAPASPTPAPKDLDFNKLWQGALAGLVAALIRFWSKGKKVKEFQWAYLLTYGAAGLIAGAYAVWRGQEFNDVFAWLESSGIVMVVYMAIKGANEKRKALMPSSTGGDEEKPEDPEAQPLVTP